MLSRIKTASLANLVTVTFALFSLFLMGEGVALGVGSLSVPEPGFFLFVAGVFLLVLTLAQLIFHSRVGSVEEDVEGEQSLPKLVSFVVALFLYCFILNFLGFLASTFLLSAAILIITSKMRWYKVAWISAVAAGFSFVTFKIMLGLPLPSGQFY